jgi:hypothetical protein
MMRVQFRVAMVQALLLYFVAGPALAQDDLANRGGAAFGEYCLMPDLRIEKMAQVALDREFKLVGGSLRGDRPGGRQAEWEVATVGSAWVRVFIHESHWTQAQGQTHGFTCVVRLGNHRDDDRRAEALFRDLMKSRPNARMTAQRATSLTYADGGDTYTFGAADPRADRPEVVMHMTRITQGPPPPPLPPPVFATPERTYRLFVDGCVRLFPDIEAITTSLNDSGWKGETDRKGSDIWSHWARVDPFYAMRGYGIEAYKYRSGASCKVSFDGRASVSMERLTRDYHLQRLPDDPLPPGDDPPRSKWENFSTVVAGRQVVMQLNMEFDGSSGSIAIIVDR